ncbi:CHAT domain-containing protein [Nocardioides sp. MH1]|uniref:CHAT domain-containing protein n=1 Tax=Nocardioides sp. MH1 TaxID=3242490 RepID=UPI003522E7BF
MLAEETDPLLRSYAHHCLGVVFRDAGRISDALDQLQLGLLAARDAHHGDRERDVRATYGVALALGGQTDAGLSELRSALEGATGESGAKVRMRYAGVLAVLGRYDDAATSMRVALAEMVGSKDVDWVARTRVWLGHLELRLGRIDVAEREILEAEEMLRHSGATLQWLAAVENLAEIAVARGDLATGLRSYADAIAAYEAAGHPPRHELVVLYADTAMAAGLSADASTLLESHHAVASLTPVEEAELDLRRSAAFLAIGDTHRATASARAARTKFRDQRRAWFELRASLAEVRARASSGEAAGLSRKAREVAAALHAEGGVEAASALILAGKLSAADARRALWHEASAYRSSPNGLVRAAAWLAAAYERESQEDARGVLSASAAGLRAIDEHRRLMGSSELRALATTHGRELTEIVLRHAAHDPRTLLRWSERTRATALAQPPATSDAAVIPASLAALRDNGRRLAEARQAGEPTEDLERERLRLERAVRTESHTISADSDPQRPASAEEVVAGVGDGCLVELVDVDGVLHVLVVHKGRVRRKVAGTTKEVADLLGPASMLLRRTARGRPASTADVGQRLQQAILGDAARIIPDGPVVLAPTARLHGLAWSLLPTLRDRPYGVVPSAGQWLRATARRRPEERRTLLVAGPDLESGGAEVPLLAERHPDAVLLDGRDATLAAVLEQLDGADLAHLATHGHFRADSPLFSSLDLADGPLTVHDLERVRTAPYRVVLSACESGVLAPVGAEELLGLAAALFSLGTAGLVSSVAEVNDAATAELMVGLHDALARDEAPAQALLEVRRAAADDPVASGTAAAFVALGV